MESIYLLIPLSIILLGVAIWGFFWAVNRGQFENLEESQNAALEEDTPLNPDAKSDPK